MLAKIGLEGQSFYRESNVRFNFLSLLELNARKHSYHSKRSSVLVVKWDNLVNQGQACNYFKESSRWEVGVTLTAPHDLLECLLGRQESGQSIQIIIYTTGRLVYNCKHSLKIRLING